MAHDVHESLQRLVDELGEAIERPVDLEDRDLHVLAYSAHEGEVDAVRRRSILARSSSRDVDAWMRPPGNPGADGPLRLPAAPELGMAPRVCVPVRDGAGLLGFLWLVDEPERPLADAEIATAVETATAAAVLLRGMREAEDAERMRRTQLLRDALHGDDVAADELIDSGALLPAPMVTVAVTAVPPAPADLGGRLRRLLPSRHALDVCVEPGELVLAITLPAGTDPGELVAKMARTVGDVVGLAEPRRSTAELAACLAEARAAALVARRVAGHGPGARFSKLGADGTLALLEPAVLARLRDIPALQALAAQDPDGALRATLLAWLDHGGDASAAAAELSLHRGTLYHRLKRIETLAGVGLEDGDTRLALHLALRAARLLPA